MIEGEGGGESTCTCIGVEADTLYVPKSSTCTCVYMYAMFNFSLNTHM